MGFIIENFARVSLRSWLRLCLWESTYGSPWVFPQKSCGNGMGMGMEIPFPRQSCLSTMHDVISSPYVSEFISKTT